MPMEPLPTIISVSSNNYGHCHSIVGKKKTCNNCAHDRLNDEKLEEYDENGNVLEAVFCRSEESGYGEKDRRKRRAKIKEFEDVPELECFEKRQILNVIIKKAEK